MNENKIAISPKGLIFNAMGGHKEELVAGKALELCTNITKELSRFMQQHNLRIEWVRANGKDTLIFVEQPETH